jgi:bifunctional DNA-binding transcriptional regulator/antitoxin component of YhaV-PrlF toxin-antitoxin module
MAMGDSQSESAGVVKCSDDGVVVIPVEVRDVLGIKNKEAFLRIEDISVAKIVDEDEDATLEDAKGGDGE